MSKKNEYAFPSSVKPSARDIGDGLTKREYFAAMAMQGLCVPAIPGHHNTNLAPEAKAKATSAVALADALLAELSKEGNS